MKTVFLRALEADDKEGVLRAAINDPGAARGSVRFDIDSSSFGVVPRSPFAYWVSECMQDVFVNLPSFENDGRIVASGGKTLDDFRWVRVTWEIPAQARQTWVGFAKLGAFSPFYSDIHTWIDWRNDAYELKEFLERTAIGRQK